MAGYIGSRAVSVNTTSATITDDLTIGDDLTVTDDMTVGGTLGVTGVVTANAGVVVDNFTLDGTSLSLSSGVMTLNAADVRIKNVANNETMAQFDDDGAVNLYNNNELSLSTVAGGSVSIYNDLSLTSDGGIINIGAGNDLKITHDGTNGDFESAGNLTIDVAGYIIIDSDDGNIYLNDDGAGYGQISGASQNLTFKSSASDKDIIFQGNDGGSAITALTLDMSEAGQAIFNAGTQATSASLTNFLDVKADDAEIYLTNAANNRYFRMQRNNSTAGIDLQFYDGSSTSTRLSFLPAGGITFNGDTAAANALDDYEEGTWTPVFQGSSGSGSYSYTASATAKYTRVGNLVTLSASLMSITEGTAMGGYVQITGLPFTKPASTYGSGPVGISQWNLGFDVVTPQIEPISYGGTTTTLYIHLHKDNAVSTNLLISQLVDTDSDIVFTFTYQV